MHRSPKRMMVNWLVTAIFGTLLTLLILSSDQFSWVTAIVVFLCAIATAVMWYRVYSYGQKYRMEASGSAHEVGNNKR